MAIPKVALSIKVIYLAADLLLFSDIEQSASCSGKIYDAVNMPV